MHENHTFTKLNYKAIEHEISMVRSFIEDELGFVGWDIGGARESYQFSSKDTDWEQRLRAIFKVVSDEDKSVKECPFCGFRPEITDADFCYPLGRPVKGVQLWQAGCVESAGGCTAVVIGVSKEEAIDLWNRRSDK